MIALITCLIAAVLGFGMYSDHVVLHSETPEITLTLPAAGLEPRLASLAGVWEADVFDSAPSRVVVEKITQRWATVLYSWPDHRSGRPGAMWERIRARVLPDGQLLWGNYPVRFSLRATEGFGTLDVNKVTTGRRVTWELKKVGEIVVAAGVTR